MTTGSSKFSQVTDATVLFIFPCYLKQGFPTKIADTPMVWCTFQGYEGVFKI